MKIELMFQSYHENLTEFRRERIKSKWDILIFVVDGEYALQVDGEKQESLVIHKNEVAFIPAQAEFHRSVLMPLTYYCICFCERGEHSFYTSASQGILSLPQTQIESILENLRLASMLPENRELIVHMVEHVFITNYLFGVRERGRIRPFSEEIEMAIRYMRENLHRKIDMEELAKHVYLSHNGLLWKFKKELNTTPSNYLYLLRMRNARRLLLGYSYRITEIAELCGYQNAYYFSNEFRRFYGMSPTEFRKGHYKADRQELPKH